MFIKLGPRHNISNFPNASKRCEAIKKHYIDVIKNFEYLNRILFYNDNE